MNEINRGSDPSYAATLVWDCHAGVCPSSSSDLSFLHRWRRAGATYVSLNVGFDKAITWQQALKCIAHYRRWVDLHPEEFVLANGVEDIRNAKQDGKLAVGFDLEGADALDGNIEMIGVYQQLGVRQVLFAYNLNNAFAGGCMDVDVPLTALGREALEELQRVGIVVDCSHTSYSSSMEMMERSTSPVIFSHSNPRALCDHPRNIHDDQIKECARTGGVVGINGIGAFLGDNDTSSARMANHIAYVAELVGTDHVGIGMDSVLDKSEIAELYRSHPELWPDPDLRQLDALQYAQPEQFPGLAAELRRTGFSEAELTKILGGNFMRIATEVWR